MIGLVLGVNVSKTSGMRMNLLRIVINMMDGCVKVILEYTAMVFVLKEDVHANIHRQKAKIVMMEIPAQWIHVKMEYVSMNRYRHQNVVRIQVCQQCQVQAAHQ